MKYAVLQSRVPDVTDDDRPGIEQFLSEISDDLARTTPPNKGAQTKVESGDRPLIGEWLEPTSWAELGRRVFGNDKERARKIKMLFSKDGVKQISRKLVRVRLDTLDLHIRRKIEKPSSD